MKPAPKLQEWVPEAIATHYQRILDGVDGEIWRSGPYGGGCGLLFEYGYPKNQLVPVITKLCTAPEMEAVWRRLGKAFTEKSIPSWETQFFYRLLWALFARSPWDYLTPKTRKKKHLKIVEALTRLATTLREYDMDSTTWDLMKPEEFEGAIERHYYTGFTQGYSESDIVGHDEPGLFLCQNPPFVSDLLERLAQAQSEQCPNNTAVAESKGQHGWDYIIFVRRMGTVFTAFLGGHRHETVDTLARVLLGVNPGDTTTRRNIEKSPYDKERTFFSE